MFCFRNAKFPETAPRLEQGCFPGRPLLSDLLQIPVAYLQLTHFALHLKI